MNIQEHISLLPFNTFHIDAHARYFVEINNVEELQELIRTAEFQETPKLILGGGSNILLTQDFDGLVVKMNISYKEVTRESDEFVWIKAGAGVVWHDMVLFSIEKGLGGIENLSLIPGTMGAAPMQNIGAYGVEIKDTFDSLEAVHIETGQLKVFDNQDCEFGYRESIFKTRLKGQYIITSVTLRLQKKPVINTSYGAIEATLQQRYRGKEIGVQEVSDAVISIRESKLPNPKIIGNAGSFFKNPVIDTALFTKVKEAYPHVPSYPQPDGMVKVPAGWLIEQAGWKGKRVGEIGVHDKQALVIVNHGSGRGEEIVALAREIQTSVNEKFGITITPEVNFI